MPTVDPIEKLEVRGVRGEVGEVIIFPGRDDSMDDLVDTVGESVGLILVARADRSSSDSVCE